MKTKKIKQKIESSEKAMAEEAIKEVREIIEELGARGEDKEIKNPAFDKASGQISLRLPKSFVEKAGVDEKSDFVMVVNPKEKDTLEEIKKSKFIIYLKKT